MKKFLILFKRMCMKPLNLIILLILPVIAITFRMLPEKSVKSSITTGIYIEQDDQWLDSFKKLMGTHSDAFVFDFSANFIEDYKSARINVLTTSNTSYDTVTMEIIMSELLKAYDGAIIDHYLSVSSSASPYYTDDAEKLLDTAYSEILNSDEIFSISANDTGEFASIRLLDFTFPFEKFAGFVIFTASLMGLLTYKKDENNNVVIGQVYLKNSSNNIIINDDNDLLTLNGVNNPTVVKSNGVVLMYPNNEDSKIKEILKDIREKNELNKYKELL